MGTSADIPPVPLPQLHHAAILAESADRSIAFYEKAIGLKLKARWDEMTIGEGKHAKTVPSVGAFMEDWTGRVIEVLQRPESGKPPDDERPINHFAFMVPDVEAAFERAKAAGAKVINPPTHAVSGPVRGEAAFIRGPDGERIELVRFVSI